MNFMGLGETAREMQGPTIVQALDDEFPPIEQRLVRNRSVHPSLALGLGGGEPARGSAVNLHKHSPERVRGAGDATAPGPPDTTEFRRKRGHPCRGAAAANGPAMRVQSN